ncbi:MBL fold metallo-hydrolase, partial [candidate division KSB1 bacterium]
ENQLEDRTFEGNNGSLVVKLIFGKVSFLFTGDIEDEAEKILLRYGDILKSDVLKVPHHGSVSSSTLAFLQAVQPRWAVISVGEWNRFGQPSPVILERLSQLQIQVLRTDENGAIIFETDGNRIWKVR